MIEKNNKLTIYFETSYCSQFALLYKFWQIRILIHPYIPNILNLHSVHSSHMYCKNCIVISNLIILYWHDNIKL